ncbi:DNA topoisomerase VI subunit B [Planctomycetota bacterium]
MAKRKRVTEGQLSFAFEGGSKSGKVAKKTKKKVVTSKSVKKRKASRSPVAAKKSKAAGKSGKKTAKKKTHPPKVKRNEAQGPEHIKDGQIAARAQEMAGRQRDISVSEFFAKNRHLLGFDNPRKALLTTVKEAVDNSLDACEEAHILPEIEVGVKQLGEDRFRVWVQDNGPGIVKGQIPNIFGRLLYGSKFHTLRMARGQQGIGISAAGMYGLLTTGKSIRITSRTGPRSQAHYYELRIDTKKNRPDVIKDEVVEWDARTGTKVEIELEARYQRGRQSVDEYLTQTAITNPHAHFRYILPDGQTREYKRTVKKVVTIPKAVRPHPYGVELGILIKMAKDTKHKTMSGFLCKDFCRVSPRVSKQILDKAQLTTRKRPKSLNHAEAEKLYRAISETKIMAPSTDCIVPIGEDALLKGLQQVVGAEFYTACTRGPAVYRGNPFQIEVGLAYGGNGYNGGNGNGKNNDNAGEQELMRVLRFANRVPLLYQQSGCAIFKSILQTNWRLYGLSQSRGALPSGPLIVIVHMASVWVPFTSESKEAVAHYPEIIKEIKLALSECGRRLGKYLRGQKRRQHEAMKRSYIEKYLPPIGEALRDILTLKDRQVKTVVNRLEEVLEKSRS